MLTVGNENAQSSWYYKDQSSLHPGVMGRDSEERWWNMKGGTPPYGSRDYYNNIICIMLADK